jgi:hypothetical protein
MPASAAMSFVEETACDGLSKGKMMLLSKFEHVAHCFLSFRLAGCSWRCLNGSFLSERKEVRFQRHTAGMSARKKACFNLRPQVKGDSHGILSFKFTPASPDSKVDRFVHGQSQTQAAVGTAVHSGRDWQPQTTPGAQRCQELY